jgi:hypothetical protein
MGIFRFQTLNPDHRPLQKRRCFMKKAITVLVLSLVALVAFGMEAKAQIPKECTTSFTKGSGTLEIDKAFQTAKDWALTATPDKEGIYDYFVTRGSMKYHTVYIPSNDIIEGQIETKEGRFTVMYSVSFNVYLRIDTGGGTLFSMKGITQGEAERLMNDILDNMRNVV